MKILIDMNIPPIITQYFENHGLTAEHWSNIGVPNAQDTEILDYARKND